ncbi:hypothetical protein BD626DRAFT_519593 [Schizophyllum amplum]|uniref:C2H2-type domain-containing protein n=1 Tax=Schizophyllum amplum TaxID=97359 RepID=A0A550BVB7_9AGAR|nr:hypothetical protein BD626DRAFT_519593 [Auriculariopsis ampla]
MLGTPSNYWSWPCDSASRSSAACPTTNRRPLEPHPAFNVAMQPPAVFSPWPSAPVVEPGGTLEFPQSAGDVSESSHAEFDDAYAGLGKSISSGRGTAFPVNSPEIGLECRMQPRSARSDNGDPANDFRPRVGSDARSAAARHRTSPESRRHFACKVSGCEGRTFTRLSTYQEHQLRHANRRTFACTEGGCRLSLNTKADFRRHLKMMHDKTTAS